MSLRRYPYTSGLMAWSLVFRVLLATAREQLHPVEFEAVLLHLRTAVARETARTQDVDLSEAA